VKALFTVCPSLINAVIASASDLIQKSVAELASHGSSVARTQEALPALPNQNDEDAATGEAGRQFRSEFLNQVTSCWCLTIT
jgi:hypothetical protein